MYTNMYMYLPVYMYIAPMSKSIPDNTTPILYSYQHDRVWLISMLLTV